MTEVIYIKKSEYDKMRAEELRVEYLKKTPEGYSKSEIMSMPDDDILDMAYFLAEGSPKPRKRKRKEPDVIYHIIDDNSGFDLDDDIPL